MWKKLLSVVLVVAWLMAGTSLPAFADSEQTAEENMYTYDIVIYGGNASGVIAAIKAAQLGKTVAVVEPNPYRIGGLTTGGLGDTDVGSSGAIGGMAQEFYKRVGAAYGKTGAQYKFEAKVALKVLQDWAAEYDIPIFLNERLDLADGVVKEDKAITSFRTESGKVFQGKVFLDCTYEGDLMAKAGVTYVTGRESNEVYGETLNGITGASDMDGLPAGIDPYVVPGDPSSGLLPRVNADAGGNKGDRDTRIQSYNFRWTLTNNAANRLETVKPDGYNEADYELLLRAIEKGLPASKIFKTAAANALPGSKMDANNNCGISTDYVGMNYDYPEADHATREKIIEAHETYQRGLLWTVQNHPRVPEEMRNYFKEWGLCADEFTENNNWSTQLYVREARRMVSDFVMTQRVCERGSAVYVGDSIGMGSYNMDSHHIQYIVKNGQVTPEGGFYSPTSPYSISYRSIVPKANECSNLLVPVCMSASHAAYGSIRMEPVFMVLGQSAATAACIAIDSGVSVQEVNYTLLADRLTQDGQVLYTGSTGSEEPPPVIDEDAIVYPMEKNEEYVTVSATGPAGLEYGYYDTAYALSPSTKYNRVFTAKGGDYIEFEIDVAKAGTYSVSAQSNLQDGRATYRLYLPDEERYLGGEFDQYGYFVNDDPGRIKINTFGNVTISEPGKLKLRFEVTGKNPQSKGYTLAFCNIILAKPITGAVTFNSNGGSKVTSQAIETGIAQLIQAPQAPTRAGYTLEGWYADKELTQKWDFAADMVSKSITLYAKWIPDAPAAYTVSFCSNYGDGGSSVGSQHILKVGDGLVAKPSDPKREGYLFKGWYADEQCEHAWDFATDTVTDDIILYAKWEEQNPAPKPVDKKELAALIGTAKTEAAKEGVYTAQSLEALAAAITAAERVASDDAAVQDAVDAQVTALQAALDGLREIPDIVWGDLDGKAGVTASDALLALQAATGKVTLDDRQKAAADVDGQDGVTAADALLILQHATGKITTFPVESQP